MSQAASGKRIREEKDEETGELSGKRSFSIPCYVVRQDFAARQIQKAYRGHMARLAFRQMKIDKFKNKFFNELASLLRDSEDRIGCFTTVSNTLNLVASQRG